MFEFIKTSYKVLKLGSSLLKLHLKVMKYWKKGGNKNEGGDRRKGNHTKELGSLQIAIIEIICTLMDQMGLGWIFQTKMIIS